MKKLITLLFIVIFLAGCTNSYEDSDCSSLDAPFSYIESDDFILRLFVDNNTYQTGEVITVWAELEYIGENESITIYHSEPYLVFQIVGDNGFEMLPYRVDVLESSILVRDETYHFDFQKSGEWSLDDEDAEFWENFFDEPNLILPPGEYTITVVAAFSLSSEDVIGSQLVLLTEISVTVQE